MARVWYALLLAAAVALVASGCESTGSGGGSPVGSDGHFGHSH